MKTRGVVTALLSLLLAGQVFGGTEEEVQAAKDRYESSRNSFAVTAGFSTAVSTEDIYSMPGCVSLSYRHRLWDTSGLGLELEAESAPGNLPSDMPGYLYGGILVSYFKQYPTALSVGKLGWALSAGPAWAYFTSNLGNNDDGPNGLADGVGGTVKYELSVSFPLARAIAGKPESWYGKLLDVDLFTKIEWQLAYVPMKANKDFSVVTDETTVYKKGDSFHPYSSNSTGGDLFFSGGGISTGVMWVF